MYNRYVHNSNGTYTRVPEKDTSSDYSSNAEQGEKADSSAASSSEQPGSQSYENPHRQSSDPLSGLLRHALDQLHLNSIDTGDLLLLGLLFFLSREHADDELLMALGLLLIL